MSTINNMRISDLLEYTLFRTKMRCRGTGCEFAPERFIAVLCELCTDSPEFAEEHDTELAPFIIMSDDRRLDISDVQKHFDAFDEFTQVRSAKYLARRLEEASVEAAERRCETVPLSCFINAVLNNPTDEMSRVFSSDYFKYTVYEPFDDDEYEPWEDEDYEQEYPAEELTSDEVPKKLADNAKQQVAELAVTAYDMRTALTKHIFGQDKAAASFADGYFRSSLDRLMYPYSEGNLPKKPMTFLFSGAPGVGKTQLAKAAADYLGITPLVINMSEGFDKNALINYAKCAPQGIVIFDEVEKAMRNVLEHFLPMLDTGCFYDVPCGGLTLIFTTNAGSSLYDNESIEDLSELPKSVLLDAIINDNSSDLRMSLFPPELGSRLSEGNIVMFRRLDANTLLTIGRDRLSSKLLELAAQMRCDITADEQVYSALLFSLGSKADARTVIGATGSMFAKATYDLVRTADSEQLCTLEEIRLAVDIPESREISELFAGEPAAAMKTLLRSNKELCFDVRSEISDDGKKAVIKLTGLRLRTAMLADDIGKFADAVSVPDVRFSDIIGAKDAKEELMQAAAFLKDPSAPGADAGGFSGILLYGPAGTGKTMLARALAGEAGVPFIATEGNRFLNKYVGDSPKSVHDIFRTARKYAPCVLFIDEVETIAKTRVGSEFTAVREEVLTALLTEMNGFRDYSGSPVYVVAATNADRKMLDPAFVRRFDKPICVELPVRDERLEFLKRRTADSSRFALSPEMLDNIAARSTDMSLAVLDKICSLALRMAARKKSVPVTDAVFDEAFESYNSGSEKKWDDKLRESTAYHEAGHALISLLTGGCPAYLTVTARSSYAGYMQEDADKNSRLMTSSGMLDKICVYLGGRAAECVVYGKDEGFTTGAGSDLTAATALARDMVCRYGMNSDIGLAVLSNADISGTLGVKVNDSVNRILDEQLRRAQALLEEHRDILDSLASELIRHDRLSGSDIRRIFDSFSAVAAS